MRIDIEHGDKQDPDKWMVDIGTFLAMESPEEMAQEERKR